MRNLKDLNQNEVNNFNKLKKLNFNIYEFDPNFDLNHYDSKYFLKNILEKFDKDFNHIYELGDKKVFLKEIQLDSKINKYASFENSIVWIIQNVIKCPVSLTAYTAKYAIYDWKTYFHKNEFYNELNGIDIYNKLKEIKNLYVNVKNRDFPRFINYYDEECHEEIPLAYEEWVKSGELLNFEDKDLIDSLGLDIYGKNKSKFNQEFKIINLPFSMDTGYF